MFWEFYQMRRISSADRKAGRAKTKADQAEIYVQRLEGKLESLALACQSLWELLRDNTDLTDDELNQKMEEIDLRDGRLDGKLSKKTDNCKSCGRKTSRRRSNCIYCGTAQDESELFGRTN